MRIFSYIYFFISGRSTGIGYAVIQNNPPRMHSVTFCAKMGNQGQKKRILDKTHPAASAGALALELKGPPV